MPSLVHLLVVLLTTTHAGALSTPQSLCPAECDCEELTTDFKQTVLIDCFRGGLNDSHFASILERLPVTVNILEIRAPANRPNAFEWDDNLNRFQKLERLSLINCGLPSISQSARLKSLTHLDLHGNAIDHLYHTTFAGFPGVEHLDLSHNRLPSLPSGAFNLLRKLKTLNLAHNKLTSLAANSFLGPKSLQTLQLDGNRLSVADINDQFTEVASLQRLELNGCGLGDLGVGGLALGQIKVLRRLGLGGNNLTHVPSAVLRDLPFLESVDLSHNAIRTLEPCAFCACNITEVLLGHNLLGVDSGAVDAEAFADTKIASIDLSFNFFDDFDAAILGYAQPSVRILDLSGNNLGGFHHRLTYALTSLTHLHMAANGIKAIPASLPYEYTRLNFFNVSKNRIEYLPDDIASLLPSLTVMDVSHNFITTLSPTVLSTFVNALDMLYLHHNPLDCRCITQGLQHFMQQRHAYGAELRFSETQCATPELLAGRPVHRVQHVNDCAVLFGAAYGLTQTSEVVLLLVALLCCGVLISVVVLAFVSCGRQRKFKGTYVTRESSRLRLTHPMIDSSTTLPGKEVYASSHSTNTSALSEPLSPCDSDAPPDHLPPPPPGSMFIAF